MSELASVGEPLELLRDVNGKRDWVSLSHEKINEQVLVDSTKSPKAGAVTSFVGVTRDNFEEKTVTHLEYEAYEPMALEYMLKICDQIREKWEVEHISIQHKLGPCPVGDTSVILVVSSPHRKEALEAIDFSINELKKSVPIWKKECYLSADPTWKANEEQPSV